LNEKEFKEKHRQDACSTCHKRQPCARMESICSLITPCSECEIRTSCTSLCFQMKAYLNRGRQKSLEFPIYSKSVQTEEFYAFLKYLEEQPAGIGIADIPFRADDLPWKALSDRDAEIVKDHYLRGLTYENIAEKNDLSIRRIYVIIHGEEGRRGALEILYEFTKYRILHRKFGKYLPEDLNKTLRQYYWECLSPKQMRKVGEGEREVYRRIEKSRKTLEKYMELL